MKERLTFFTCSIFPDVTRIWHHCLSKIDRELYQEVVIYDSSGLLNPLYFPNTRIISFPNKQHGIKIDHFLKRNLRSDLCFLLDDDAFILSDHVIQYGVEWLTMKDSNTVISYKPRDWWKMKVNGKEHDPMGSYALLFKRNTIAEKQLSFEVKVTENKEIRNGSGYYDTGDFLQQQLLTDNLNILIAPSELREMVPTFFGTSSGFLMFYKKGWFSKSFQMQDRSKCIQDMMADGYNFARAFAVANTIELHDKIFDEKSNFNSFFTTAGLLELLNSVKDEAFLNKVTIQIERCRFINKAILAL